MPNALEWLAGSRLQDMTRKRIQQLAICADAYQSNTAGRATTGPIAGVKNVEKTGFPEKTPSPSLEGSNAARRPAAATIEETQKVENPRTSERATCPGPGSSEIIINLNISNSGDGSSRREILTASAGVCKFEERRGKDSSLPQMKSAMKGGRAAQEWGKDEDTVYHCRGCGRRKVTVKWDLPSQAEDVTRRNDGGNVRQDLTSQPSSSRQDRATSQTVSAQTSKRDIEERESGDKSLIQSRCLPLHHHNFSPRQTEQQQRLARFLALPSSVRANMARQLQDPLAEVVVRQDLLEDPRIDPYPNAYYDAATGRLTVYHGPRSGNSGRLTPILPPRWPVESDAFNAYAGVGLPNMGQAGPATTSGIDMGMNYPGTSRVDTGMNYPATSGMDMGMHYPATSGMNMGMNYPATSGMNMGMHHPTRSGMDMGMSYPSWSNIPPAIPGARLPYSWAPPYGYTGPYPHHSNDLRSGTSNNAGLVNGHGQNPRNASHDSNGSMYGNHASIITNNPWNMPTNDQSAAAAASGTSANNNNSAQVNAHGPVVQNGQDANISPLALDPESKEDEQGSSWLDNGATNGDDNVSHPSLLIGKDKIANRKKHSPHNDDWRHPSLGSPSSVDSWMEPGAMGPTHVSPRRGRTLTRTPAWGDASAANSTTAWGNADGVTSSTEWNNEARAEERSSGPEPAWGDAPGANSTSEWGNGEAASSGW